MSVLGNKEYFRSLIVPTPLSSIEKKLRKDHSSSKIVKDLIRDYVKKNSDLYENLAEIMLELMRSEISFEEPNEYVLKEYGKKIRELDTRFNYIDNFMNDMNERDKNALWRDYVLESISNLNKLRPDIVKNIKRKESWNNNDALFISYYDLYTNLLNSIALTLAKSKKMSDSDKILLSFASFIYQVVIYAYVKDELDEKIMLRRFSELRLMALNDTERLSKGRKDFVKNLKEVPPISE
ncbi:hypothetical protein Thermo_00399 [Thermoplasmatales archaeon]|nr:hypothetical protein Thermo_00399 [Thermoplasmatales archaeon]